MVHADGGVASADGDDVGTLGMRMRKVFVRPRSDQSGMNVERRGDAGFLVLLMLTRGRADFSTSSLTIAIGTAGGPTWGQCLNSPLTYLPPPSLLAPPQQFESAVSASASSCAGFCTRILKPVAWVRSYERGRDASGFLDSWSWGAHCSA